MFYRLFNLTSVSRLCLCLLFLILVSCGDDDNKRTPASTLEVVGLKNDEEFKQSKTWQWSCEENKKEADCVYRYVINKKSSHTFSSNNKYTDTTEISTDEGLNGRYYLHVEAKSEATDRKSEVKSVFARLDNTPPGGPSSSSFNVPRSSANSRIRVTVRQLKAGDQVHIYLEGGTNSDFLQNIFSFLPLKAVDSSNICVEENEVGSGTVASGRTEVILNVNTRAGEHEYYAMITDEAGNTSDCERVFIYENIFVPEPPVASACPSIKPGPHWKFVDNACRPSCGTIAGIAGYKGDRHVLADGRSCSSLVTGGHSDWRNFHIMDGGQRINSNDVWEIAEAENDQVCCARGSAVSPRSPINVTGLRSDSTPKGSKTWSWECDKDACLYRYVINTYSSHVFAEDVLYTGAKTATQSNADRRTKYYLHVQARFGSQESPVKSVSAILIPPVPLEVTGLKNDATAKIVRTWRWGCNNSPCTYRYEINQNRTHTFRSNDRYSSTATAVKRITSSSENGTYYIHVQARDSDGRESEVETVSAVFRIADEEDVVVTGLSHDTSPKASKTWSWGCNKSSCTYRYVINQNRTHTFRSSDRYGSTKTATKRITSSSQNGTYYIHVQARDSSGNVSEVESVLAILNISTTGDVRVTGLEHDTDAGSSKTWSWGCNKSSCTYRYRINQSSSHTFSNSDSYGSTKTATKRITSSSQNGTYYIHVQARDSSGNVSEVESVLAILNISTTGDVRVTGLEHDTDAGSSKTWNWGCNKSSCTYRYRINQSSSHTFRSSDSYGSTRTATKSISSSSEDGTYYIHVQARDSSGNVSEVESVLAILRTEITTSDVLVTGLEHDTSPKASKTWTWGCNKSSCTYRYRINQSSSHTFSSRDSYGSTKTATKRITSSSENGTYYIHVQARDSSGNVSAVESVLAILRYSTTPSGTVQVTGLSHDTSPKASKTWTWGCNKSSCTYRYRINQSSSHTFSNSDSYGSTKTATKRITSSSEDGTYYIHVQARDSSGNVSAVESVLAILRYSTSGTVRVTGLAHDTNADRSKTWNWGCSQGSCTYRYAINQSSSHTFRSSDSYGSTRTATKSISSSSQDGTYYIHVQARDSNGNVSAVESVLAILRYSTSATVRVTGLAHDTNPKASKTWGWGCNRNSCTYRYVINQNRTHIFSSRDSYNSITTVTKSITSANENGTYYIHVQARDSDGNVSAVESVLVILRTTTIISDVRVTDLQNDTNPKRLKVWRWGCNKNSCTYRYIINQRQTHTFSSNDRYLAINVATKSISSSSQDGTYYIHVQARDSNGNVSNVTSALAILRYGNVPTGNLAVTGIVDDLTAGRTKNWRWSCMNNSGTCTYRHVMNTDATHTFEDSDTYNTTTTATKTAASNTDNGTYYLHVQAKDASGTQSPVKSVVFYLSFEIILVKNASDVDLTSPTNPGTSRAWTWKCRNAANDADGASCTYRHVVNTSAAYFFSDDDAFGATTTQTISISTGHSSGTTHYLHIQAKDGSGRLSPIVTVFITLTNEAIIVKNPIEEESLSKASVKWTWECDTDNNPTATAPCSYRYAIVKEADATCDGHTFDNDVDYDSTTTITKTITGVSEDGDYCLYVQTKDSSDNVSVVKNIHQELTFELLVLKDPVAYKANAASLPTKLQLHVDRYPTFTVLGFSSGNRVRLYSSNQCTDGSNDDEGDPTRDTRLSNEVTVPSNNQTDITLYLLEHFRTYPIYVGIRESSSDSSVDCWAATSSSDSTPVMVTDSNKSTVKPLFEYTLYSSISAGGGHTCYLSPGGDVKCWGLNGAGQLGYGNTTSTNVPPDNAVTVWGNRKVKAIATGLAHTCAILEAGSVRCWGDNSRGQLGRVGGSTVPTHTPGDIGQLGLNVNVEAIATGGEHTCVILNDDSLRCWGLNNAGQLGLNSNVNQPTPLADTPVDLGCENTTCEDDEKYKVQAVAAGGYFTCVILLDDNDISPDNSGKVLCWGANPEGQLGQNDRDNRGHSDADGVSISSIGFVDLGSGRTAQSISAGQSHACVLLDNNTTKCWGHNILGQLGQNSVDSKGDAANEMRSLGTINLGGSARSIMTNHWSNHTCAVLSNNNALKCWGNNWAGQLGQGDITEFSGNDVGRDATTNAWDGSNIVNNRNHGSGRGSDVPATTVRLARTVSSLPGINFGCNVATDREGNTPACSSSTNFKLKSPDSVAVGRDHTCVVLQTTRESDQGKEFVKCWGGGGGGQLGQGDFTNRGGTSETTVSKIPALEFSFSND